MVLHGVRAGIDVAIPGCGILGDGADIGRVSLTTLLLSAAYVAHRLRVRQAVYIEATSMDDPWEQPWPDPVCT